ncbi:hypothetical protein [Arthrobacter sp. Bz4]|uniref:hypothetical protein n=1 Tax=Arthrobacter sp. Bz4 TaxID=2171979 RepID=UPI0014027623|nr:hypothetical protein [Arthrobacter sp. Bz4]
MYGWLFRHLPGPLWARIIIALALIAGIVILLFRVIFPWFSDILELSDPTIGTLIRL